MVLCIFLFATSASAQAADTTAEPQVEKLLEGLNSSNKETREEAAFALRCHRESRVFEALLERIDDPKEDQGVRWRALWSLRQEQEEELLPHYTRMLSLPDDQLWTEAAQALEVYGPKAKAALPQLREGLKSEKRCIYAASTLAAIGDRAAIPALMDCMKKFGEYSAARALGRLKAADAVPLLIEALESRKYSLSAAAAWALGEIGDKKAVPALRKGIFDDRSDIRDQVFECAVALKKLTGELPENAGDRMLDILTTGYFKNTGGYVRILTDSGDKDYAPMIIECLNRTDVDRRLVARELENLTGVKLGEDYVAWRLWLTRRENNGKLPELPANWDQYVKAMQADELSEVMATVRALAASGEVRAIPPLEIFYDELPDQQLELRAEALRALACLGKRNALTRLFLLAWDRALPEQRCTVLERAIGLRDRRMPRLLWELARETDDPEIRRTVLQIAAGSFQMEHLFEPAEHYPREIVAMAERELFKEEADYVKDYPIFWREGAAALEAILGIQLVPEGVKDPQEIRARSRQRWAAFVVKQAVETMMTQKPGEQENSPAARAFTWIDDRGYIYTDALTPLMLDERPLGQQRFWVYRGNMSPDPLDVRTVADVATQAFRDIRRLPPNKKLADFCFERLKSKDETQARRASVFLALMDDEKTIRRLLDTWEGAADSRHLAFVEKVIAEVGNMAVAETFKAMIDSPDRATRKRAVRLFRRCVIPVLWNRKKEEYFRAAYARMGGGTYPFALRMPDLEREEEERLRHEFDADTRTLSLSVAGKAVGLDREERLWAIEEAERLGASSLYPKVIEALGDDDRSGVVRIAIRAAAKLGGKEAAPHIEPFLDAKEPNLRLEAARALSELRAERAIPKLRKSLNDRRLDVAAEAAHGLGLMGDRESSSTIAALLDDKSWKTRIPENVIPVGELSKVVGAIGNLGISESIPGLLEIAKDPGHFLRQPALKALIQMRVPDAIPVLKQVAEEQGEGYPDAIRGIGIIGGEEARTYLRRLLEKEISYDLPSIGEGLARAGDRRGYDLLVELLGAGQEAERARMKLIELTGRALDPKPEGPDEKDARRAWRESLLAWRAWWKEHRHEFGKEYDE